MEARGGLGYRFLIFKTGALNHSTTLPVVRHQLLDGCKIKNSLARKCIFADAHGTCSRHKPDRACADQFQYRRAIRLDESSTKPAAVKARKPSERRS